MKKHLSLAIIVLLAVSAAGCSQQNTASSPSPASSPTVQAATSAPAPSAAPSKSSTPATSAKPTASPVPSGSAKTSAAVAASSPLNSDGKDYSELGNQLLKSESLGGVKIGMTESELIKLLGQPASKSAAVVWGADGLSHSDWSYSSKGLNVNLSKDSGSGKEAVVYSIRADSSCTFATARGIKAGSSKTDVLKAYGAEIDSQVNKDTNDKIIIGSVFSGIVITLNNNAVSSIFVGTSAE